MAKTIGFAAMLRSMSGVSAPLADNPKNTSQPTMASASDRALVSTAWALFHWFMPSVRPRQTTPLVSQRITFSLFTPIDLSSSMQAMPAAPAPLVTTLISSSLRPVR